MYFSWIFSRMFIISSKIQVYPGSKASLQCPATSNHASHLLIRMEVVLFFFVCVKEKNRNKII